MSKKQMPDVVWLGVAGPRGPCFDKPRRCKKKANWGGGYDWWDSSGTWEAKALGERRSYAAIEFVSENKEEVALWLRGALAQYNAIADWLVGKT